MKNKMGLYLVLVIVIIVVIVSGCSDNSGDNISIGAGTEGGGMNNAATAWSNAINDDTEIKSSVQVVGGAVENTKLLNSEEIDFGLSTTEVNYEAYNGEGQFKDEDPNESLRALFPAYPSVYMLVTLESSGVDEIEDLDGSSYVLGPSQSSNELFTKRLFESLKIDADTSSLPVDDSADALKDNTIDGFTTTWPTPAVKRLESEHELNILTLDDEQKEKFEEDYPQYSWLSIPSDTYESIPDGAENMGMMIFTMSREDVSEDLAYDIVKAAYENIDIIEDTNPDMADELKEESIKESTVPYHPGAVKYFKENDIDVPEDLLPPEMEE